MARDGRIIRVPLELDRGGGFRVANYSGLDYPNKGMPVLVTDVRGLSIPVMSEIDFSHDFYTISRVCAAQIEIFKKVNAIHVLPKEADAYFLDVTRNLRYKGATFFSVPFYHITTLLDIASGSRTDS